MAVAVAVAVAAAAATAAAAAAAAGNWDWLVCACPWAAAAAANGPKLFPPGLLGVIGVWLNWTLPCLWYMMLPTMLISLRCMPPLFVLKPVGIKNIVIIQQDRVLN